MMRHLDDFHRIALLSDEHGGFISVFCHLSIKSRTYKLKRKIVADIFNLAQPMKSGVVNHVALFAYIHLKWIPRSGQVK